MPIINPLSSRMKNYILGAVLSLGILISPPAFTQAATLTTAQIDAIISLLASFGADATAIANVKSTLSGTPTSVTPAMPPTSTPPSPTIGDIPPDTGTVSCLNLQNNLVYRSTDAKTRGEVSALQDFLQTGGYLNSDPSGFFGLLTVAAAKKYQASVGLDQTGYVGPLTRGKIKDATCGGVYNLSLQYPVGGEVFAPGSTIIVRWSSVNLSGLQVNITLESLDAQRHLASQIPIEKGSTQITIPISDSLGTLKEGPATLILSVTNIKDGDPRAVYTKAAITISSKQGGITVTSPNGGEQWEIGQLNTITWTPYQYNPDINPAKDVDVYLEYENGTRVGKVMDEGKASLHTYFHINDYSTYAQPGLYYIRATNRVTGATDRNDSVFTLLPRAIDIKVNGSDGPITLSDNQPVTVTFGAGSVPLQGCYLNGVRETVNGAPGVAISEKYSIEKPFYGYAYAPTPDSSTAIYVTCTKTDGTTRSDSVQVNMTGTTVASLQITSPNGGELITANDITQVKIAWRMESISTPISIALYKNDKWLFWIEKDLGLDKSLDGTYSYVWAPNAKGPALPALDSGVNSGFKIYVTGQKADGTGYVEDKSDAPFSFVSAISLPNLTFTASPTTVNSGQSSTLTWSSNADSYCEMDGSKLERSGSLSTGSLYTTKKYTITCHNLNGGGITGSVTVTVTVSGPSVTVDKGILSTSSHNPTFTGSATGLYGVQLVLYSSSNSIVGVRGVTAVENGRWTMGPLAQTIPNGTYRLEIKGTLASNDFNPVLYATETVVISDPVPTLTLTANPSTITLGQSVVLSWTSANATSCAYGPDSSGESLALSGTKTTESLYGTQIFHVTCKGAGGSVTKSVAVTVNATQTPPPAPASLTGSCSTDGKNITLSWPPSAGATMYFPAFVPVNNGVSSGSCPSDWALRSSAQYCYIGGVNTATDGPSFTGGITGTSVTFPVQSGMSYTAWVNAANANGVSTNSTNGWLAAVQSFSCTATNQTASVLNAFNSAVNAGVSQSTTGFAYVWNRDLQIGSPYTTDVSALQRALTLEQMYVGEITGGFYDQTFAAVKAFQRKYDIESTGYVGPNTRSLLNTLYSN